VYHDICAFVDASARDRFADACRASGDQDYLVFEAHALLSCLMA
jgi:hypothetical protein